MLDLSFSDAGTPIPFQSYIHNASSETVNRLLSAPQRGEKRLPSGKKAAKAFSGGVGSAGKPRWGRTGRVGGRDGRLTIVAALPALDFPAIFFPH